MLVTLYFTKGLPSDIFDQRLTIWRCVDWLCDPGHEWRTLVLSLHRSFGTVLVSLMQQKVCWSV